MNQTIKKVGEDIESFKFNTAIAALMTLINIIEKEGKISLSKGKIPRITPRKVSLLRWKVLPSLSCKVLRRSHHGRGKESPNGGW